MQSAVTPTPTPTPTPIAGAASSPDIAVSSISNAGASSRPLCAVFRDRGHAHEAFACARFCEPALLPDDRERQHGSIQRASDGDAGAFLSVVPERGGHRVGHQPDPRRRRGDGGQRRDLHVHGHEPVGSLTSSAAVLSVVNTSDPGRLINLSCRAQVGTGGNILISGFAVGPIGTSGTEPLLIRGSGPALAAFGVTGTLPDPQLQLFSGVPVLLDSNFGWNGSTAISSTASAVGAFSWSSKTSLDSALVESLSVGPYSAQVLGKSGDTGVALAEVYDATPAGTYTLASRASSTSPHACRWAPVEAF